VPLREKIISLGILAYLFLTLCAFSYTFSRRSPLPAQYVRYFYGMMAPYQGYTVTNFALIAEGQTSAGTIERIDRHFPLQGKAS